MGEMDVPGNGLLDCLVVLTAFTRHSGQWGKSRMGLALVPCEASAILVYQHGKEQITTAWKFLYSFREACEFFKVPRIGLVKVERLDQRLNVPTQGLRATSFPGSLFLERDPGPVLSRASQTIENIREGSSNFTIFVFSFVNFKARLLHSHALPTAINTRDVL